ncbi:hypothetical protein [Alienimonas chondri]|uniref:DoxX family protein n=1 Tax=Alienimonas chondri TaxID=2681879 RepID=A0ABX1VD65_9PLAN|nr:hypothetical protein [Alienimonas chondri]NNJ25837.1 hypothetical protein [Alienimonas chondri]
MSPKVRRTAGLVLIWLVGLALAASAGLKLAGIPVDDPAEAPSVETGEAAADAVGDSSMAGGFAELMVPLGLVELASAVLLLIPLTHRLGLLLCVAYLGGAMAASIATTGLSEAIPSAVLQAMLWTGATLYTPDLLGRILVREPASGSSHA